MVLNMDRRKFLKGIGMLAGAGAASSVLFKPKHLNIMESPEKEFEFLVDCLLPEFIMDTYKWQRDGQDEPKELRERVHSLSKKYNLGLSEYELSDEMIKRGYVFAKKPSVCGSGDSYLFGKISDDTIVNGTDWSKHKNPEIVFYDETSFKGERVQSFEDYQDCFMIFERAFLNHNKIIVNNTTSELYANNLFDWGEYYKNNPKKKEGFMDEMILKEHEFSGSPERLCENLIESYIHHEITHFEKGGGVEGEVEALLTQMQHQPFLTLFVLKSSMNEKPENNQTYKLAAERIFSMFKEYDNGSGGYTLERIKESGANELIHAASEMTK
ncbi:MAG: twin-arginine translocation signal domain-containing protein [Candidatus Woesearchaeota archaeon]